MAELHVKGETILRIMTSEKGQIRTMYQTQGQTIPEILLGLELLKGMFLDMCRDPRSQGSLIPPLNPKSVG